MDGQHNFFFFSACPTTFIQQNSTRYNIPNPKVISTALNYNQCYQYCVISATCTIYQVTTTGSFVCTVGASFIPYTNVSDPNFSSAYFDYSVGCTNGKLMNICYVLNWLDQSSFDHNMKNHIL